MLIFFCLSVTISFDLLEFLPFIPFQALFPTLQSTHTLELALHLEQKVIKLKHDALRLMNVALADTACGQILSLFEYAFGYPEPQESKEQGKELEELDHHFNTDNESVEEGDTISKEQDVANGSKQFATAPPKAKWCKFGRCKDDLPNLVPLHQALLIMPSASIKLSETGIP